MSSNIEVKRICLHCKKEFIARTTVTKYCSHQCSRKAWKARERAKKIEESNKATFNFATKDLQEINVKQFLTVKEVAVLLQISRRTAYRLIKSKVIPSVKISQRITLISRKEINDLFIKKENIYTPTPPPDNDIEDCYSISEAEKIFNISSSALYKLIQREGIQKIKKGKHVFIPRHSINRILKK